MLPCVLATTSVLPLALGVGSSFRGRVRTRFLPSILAVTICLGCLGVVVLVLLRLPANVAGRRLFRLSGEADAADDAAALVLEDDAAGLAAGALPVFQGGVEGVEGEGISAG